MLRNLNKRILPFLAVVFNLFGAPACAPKAWVIKTSGGGGVIGYQPDLDEDAKAQRVNALIKCPEYQVVRDEMNPKAIVPDTMPLTLQPSSEANVELGSPSPVRGIMGSDPYSVTSATIPSKQAADALDGSYKELEYICRPAAMVTEP